MRSAPHYDHAMFHLFASLLLLAAASKTTAECRFEANTNNYSVIVATASAIPLGFIARDSTHEAGRIDIIVGKTKKPVVLMLLDGNAVVWVLKRTKQARIAGVILADGAMPSTLLGLPADIPVLHTGTAAGGDCAQIQFARPGDAKLNDTARALTGRSIKHVIIGGRGLITIGDTGDDDAYLNGPEDAEIAALRDPSLPDAGSAFVENAVKRGLLRPAYTADLVIFDQTRRLNDEISRAIRDAPPLANPAPNHRQALQGRGAPVDSSYIVLGNLALPPGTHRNRYTFYVPDGVHVDGVGSQLAANLLSRTGVACDTNKCMIASPPPVILPADLPQPNGSKPSTLAAACTLPPPPEPFRVFAVGGTGGWPAGFALPGTRNEAYKIDVIINLPGAPIVLMLGEYETRIWSIRWTPGTRIAAVWASGHHRQEVVGLPASVSLLRTYYQRDQPDCPYFRVIKGDIDKLNPLSRAVFGQRIEAWYETRGGGVYLGARPEPSLPLLADESRSIDDLRDSAHPYAGIALIQDLEQKGIIRPASHRELRLFGKHSRKPRPAGRQEPAYERQGASIAADPEFPDGQRAAHTYVVLRSVQLDGGLQYRFKFTLLVPRDVELTGDAEEGDITVLRTNHLACDEMQCLAQ